MSILSRIRPHLSPANVTRYGLRVLVLLASATFLVRGDWASFASTLLVAGLMTVPSLLRDRYRVFIPTSIDISTVVFIFLTLFLGQIGNLYDYVPFWDKFVHFQSGILFGATGFTLVYTLKSHRRNQVVLSPLFVAVFAVAFSLAIAALWEIGEFAWDAALGHQTQASLDDTMLDLIAATVGALITSSAGYAWMKLYDRIPFTPETRIRD